jgi:twitching motility protein PilT
MNIGILLEAAAQMEASDLHISPGIPPTVRLSGDLKFLGEERVTADMSRSFAKEIMKEEQWQAFIEKGEYDFAISVPGKYRYRANAYMQRQSVALALRLIKSSPPDINELGLPPVISTMCSYSRGLILVTGPTGSGKTTTLASMVDKINSTSKKHIITLEDPIEYLHRHKKSIVNQREIGADSDNFQVALRAALRQDPDIILVGEMRDLETISIAITAAETGHLVMSSLHTTGAAKTIDRIIDVFPPFQQQQIRMQLSMTLVGIVSQQLILSTDGKSRVAAVETLMATSAIRNLIRENKVHQIASAMQSASGSGMQLMDNALANLFRAGRITRESALAYCVDKNYISTLL